MSYKHELSEKCNFGNKIINDSVTLGKKLSRTLDYFVNYLFKIIFILYVFHKFTIKVKERDIRRKRNIE